MKRAIVTSLEISNWGKPKGIFSPTWRGKKRLRLASIYILAVPCEVHRLPPSRWGCGIEKKVRGSFSRGAVGFFRLAAFIYRKLRIKETCSSRRAFLDTFRNRRLSILTPLPKLPSAPNEAVRAPPLCRAAFALDRLLGAAYKQSMI